MSAQPQQGPVSPTERDRPADDISLVAPVGEIDALSAPMLRRDLDAAIVTGRSLVLVDLSRVTFLDSAGLAVLVGVRRELPAGQAMALACVPVRMQRVLQVAALDSLMAVHRIGEVWPWSNLPEPHPPGQRDPQPVDPNI